MNKLVTTAIVGTGQQSTIDLSTGTAVDEFTKRLEGKFSGSSEVSGSPGPERTLLLAAGAWALYQQAGYMPQSSQISCQPAPVEEMDVCSSKTAQLLTNILHSKRDILLPEALEKVRQARQRVPHELLPQMLTYGSKNKEVQTALLPVLGERGHWLAQFSHEWAWAMATPTEADFMRKSLPEIEMLWQEGTLQQRVEILRHVRTTDPDTALNWLMSTWKKENLEARTAFIALLEINLAAADEEFLERSLNDRGDSVCMHASSLLERIPTSAFNRRMQERADTLLQHIAGKLQITPPAKFDPTWKRDGIAQEGESGLLFQIISRVPPSHWETHFALTPPGLIEAISTAEKAPEGWIEAVIKGVTIAAHRYASTTWLELLLDWWSVHAGRDNKEYINLFKHISSDRVEQYTLSHLFVHANWVEELIALPRPWSSSFSRACLETLQQRALELVNSNNNYSNYHTATALINTIAIALPPDCFEAAIASEWTFSTEDTDSKDNNNNWYTRYWIDQINTLKTLLRLRKKMLKEIV